MGAIGDFVRGMSLASHIKSSLPQSKITWLVEPVCAQLARSHPQIDKVIMFDRPKNVLALLGLYRALYREEFDIVLDLQRHFKSGFFSLLSGAKRRIGFNKRNAKELNWLFNNEHIAYFNEDTPKIDHYFEFTKYLGLPNPVRPDFGFSWLDLKTGAPEIATMIHKPFVAVVMGSSWESKNWIPEGYYHLIQKILSSGRLNVVLVGDSSQTAIAEDLFARISSPDPSNVQNGKLANLVGKTSLMELTAVLKEAAAGVGPDSGPGHLASAVGTRYVSLFGPTSPKRVAPYGSEHLVVQADGVCAPCNKRRCPESHKRCMRDIRIEDVIDKLSDALGITGSK